VAFQLTNILRDIKEDAGLGRIYLPAEDLARFGVTEKQLAEGDAVTELLRFEAARARKYYKEALPLLDLVDKHSRPSLWALIEIYSRLLDRIERSKYDVFSRRISLSAAQKCWIVARAALYRLG
jgi:15-cis-phytoene synthase